MEIKVDISVVKHLVARHMSEQVGKYVAPKDVHINWNYMMETNDYAFAYLDDELED